MKKAHNNTQKGKQDHFIGNKYSQQKKLLSIYTSHPKMDRLATPCKSDRI